MADPFSIVTASFGLSHSAAKVSKYAYDFTIKVRDARKSMDGIRRELVSIESVLRLIAEDIRLPGATHPPTLESILNDCETNIGHLEALLVEYDKERLSSKIKYVWRGKDKMEEYQKVLAKLSVALSITVELITLSVARKAEESTARIMASQKNAEAKSQQIMSGVSNLQKDTTQIIDQNQEIKQILERILAEVQSLKSLRSPLPATVGEAFHSDLSQLCSYAESTVVESSGSSTSQRLKNSDEHTAQSKQRLIVVQPSANEAMQSSAPPHRVSQTSKRIAENSGAASIGTRSAQKLHDAIVYANLEAVEKELNQGADPGGGARGEPPLITAARKRVGDCKDTVAIVKALLRRGVDVNQRRGLGGSTALIESAGCSRGDSDTLKILLEHGADIHSRSNTAYTALAQACAVKDLPKIKLLINAGSEVKRFRTNNGRSLLHLGSTFIISEVLSLLLERGADINARDDKGRTPLFESTSYGNVSDMRTLIEKGADILAQDFNGRTLLHAAENENEYTDTHKKEAWQYLLSPGLDPKIADSSGNFPKPH